MTIHQSRALLAESQRESVAGSVRHVAILGATGSIGENGLDVIAASNGRLVPILLTAHRQTGKLAEAARRFHPQTIIVTDETADRTPLETVPKGTEILFGESALEEAVRRPEIDVVLAAIVGSAGLRGTWNAVEAGKTVALANKESLVLAGPLLMDLAKKSGGKILPVDSEHSAVWQALAARRIPLTPYGDITSPVFEKSSNKKDSVHRLILTASGGPFRNRTQEELTRVTVADALAHPTWKMGKKITIDSATMMNKAFEIIEARWLFDIAPKKIDVMIHPQSIIHSMVEFIDGAVLAQMGTPDMRLPIQLALYDMERIDGIANRIDWTQIQNLEWIPPDCERFPAIPLGRRVASEGGTSGAVVNAANEVAVAAFLQGKISFNKITTACQTILDHHQFEERPSLSRLFEIDRQARMETQKWISD